MITYEATDPLIWDIVFITSGVVAIISTIVWIIFLVSKRTTEITLGVATLIVALSWVTTMITVGSFSLIAPADVKEELYKHGYDNVDKLKSDRYTVTENGNTYEIMVYDDLKGTLHLYKKME